MTTQTKALLAQIHAELDVAVPGWRSGSSFEQVLFSLAGDRAMKIRELVGQYRLVQKQLSRAVPSLPKVESGDGVRGSGDKDVPLFDRTPAGRHVLAERHDQIGEENPSLDQSYDDDDVEPRGAAQASVGRCEDSLFHQEMPREPKMGKQKPASFQQRVRALLKIDGCGPLRFNPVPPRTGALALCY